MLNFGSSKLDEILAANRMDKEHHALGYSGLGKTVSTQTIFVKVSTSGGKKDKDTKLKATVATLARAPVVTPTRTLVYDTRYNTLYDTEKNERKQDVFQVVMIGVRQHKYTYRTISKTDYESECRTHEDFS